MKVKETVTEIGEPVRQAGASALVRRLVDNPLVRNPLVALAGHLAGLLLRLLPRRRAAQGQTKATSKQAKASSGQNQGKTKADPRHDQGKTKVEPGQNQGETKVRPRREAKRPLVEVCSRVRLTREGVRHA